MKSKITFAVVVCAALLAGCATTVPRELVSARDAYRRADAGVTAQIAPAELHVASLALAEAEKSFQDSPDSYRTRDLAYIAERKVQIAEARASIIVEKDTQARSQDNYEATQDSIISKTKKDLSQTHSELTASEQKGERTADQLDAEQVAHAAAEKRAADAQAALAKLAAVKDEPRGMVITLSGSVLFASNQTTLLPEAKARLDQVADVLLANRERSITIEGHTDSQGTDAHNLTLSQGRAEAVRSYLIGRGYQADLIQAQGMGEGQPVASNGNAEGRANNRRVEIIIPRDPSAPNQITSNQ